MNYYYDFIINLDSSYHYFYEMDNDKTISVVKKMPIIRIRSEIYENILMSSFKVDDSFLSLIANKSKFKNETDTKYICIMSDTKNAFVVEFNMLGESINKSSLILEDELNICELSFTNEFINLVYDLTGNEILNEDTYQNMKIKKFIKLEIDTCLNNKEYNKLKFLYLEWFGKICDNIEDIVKDMNNRLNENITDKEYEIYKLIKISYNNV